MLLLPLFLLLMIRCAAAEGDNNVVASDRQRYDPVHRDKGVQDMLDQAVSVEKPTLRDKLWFARCATATTTGC